MYHVVYTIYIASNVNGDEVQKTYVGKPKATLEEAQESLAQLVDFYMRVPGTTKSEEFSAVTVYEPNGNQTEFMIAEAE